MRRRVWVLMKQTMGGRLPWTNHFVLSKRAWQKYAKTQKDPTYTLTLRNQWLAESEDKVMLEGMMKLLEEN
jgi:hypothetical protein